ncbi:unnamed protein product [Cuscuta europaea]|uniref:Bifunctional inhibitor/plant lipid transfer protein/seed storage helical domain-containing protein n=1 Tax=Cuscuta europaea TaxID=41803 RepID=A0A9P0YV99_CUSEU|nr:unnamed protein product [Cuscuta europaea]
MAATKAIFIVSSLLLATLAVACGEPCKPTEPKPETRPKPTTLTHKGPPVDLYHHCPRNALKLGVCTDLLGGLINIEIGHAPTSPCCSFLEGLADMEAAACLCTALKANVLGLNLAVPVALGAVVGACHRTIPPGFICH